MKGITVKLPDDWHEAIESVNPIKAEYVRAALAEKLQRDGFTELSKPGSWGDASRWETNEASANPGAAEQERGTR